MTNFSFSMPIGAGRPPRLPLSSVADIDFVPVLRRDFVRRDIEGESVVWSPIASDPVALDPIATVMLDVIDGVASIGELALDVHETIGVPLETAQTQVRTVVDRLAYAGVLATSDPGHPPEGVIARRVPFISSETPCAESVSRVGTISLSVRIGDDEIRIACDSRRGARKLRDALAAHALEPSRESPLAFVLTAPQGLKRNHQLIDRSGFVLSEARGLDAGLHALASHLTAFLVPASGTARIRARGIVSGDATVVCLPPLLAVPTIDEGELRRRGLAVIDRLALDIEIATGRIMNPDIPWTDLATLPSAPGHVGTGGTRDPRAVVRAAPVATPTTPAAYAAEIAANGLSGSVTDLLDAAVRLVQRTERRSVAPDTSALIELLSRFGSAD